MSRNSKGQSYFKIIAITLSVVAGACAVIWFALKLYRKYCLLECDYDDDMDELAGDEDASDTECEIIVEDELAES